MPQGRRREPTRMNLGTTPSVLATVFALGCAVPALPTPPAAPTGPADTATTTTTWQADTSRAEGHPVYHATVANPTTGAALSTYLELPDDGDAPFRTVVLVPGSTAAATEEYARERFIVDAYLGNGLAVAYFDADGRGESTGVEDTGGYAQQDGLLAVSAAVAENPHVDEVGLVSHSFGVAMASGMLARHPDEVPFAWYMDWEGPVDRMYASGGCGEDPEQSAHLGTTGLGTDCADDAFWSEREAINFLPRIDLPYQRLQGAKNHTSSDSGTASAIDAIDAAAAGVSPWTRINEEPPNHTFTSEDPPDYFEQVGESLAVAPDFARALFDRFGG